MEKVSKVNSLLTETYSVEYKPSGDTMNPYVKVIEHKVRPRLAEVFKRDKYRRSLSQLFKSSATDPCIDKEHKAMNTLHNFEKNLQGKVS